MKLVSLAACLAMIPGCVQASGFCRSLPMDAEVPAGLEGSYEIVGKDPASGAAYVGKLVLGHGKDAYSLARTIADGTIEGDAWFERCGADDIRTLMVRYDAMPAIEMACTLDADGGNYYRITCRARQAGRRWQGLEAWFQQR
jgi:hypothetical protein